MELQTYLWEFCV